MGNDGQQYGAMSRPQVAERPDTMAATQIYALVGIIKTPKIASVLIEEIADDASMPTTIQSPRWENP
jgi:hypothetical protein